MGLEKLKAEAINANLFSLSVEGLFDDLVHRDELKFQASLEVPDPSMLGRQMGFDVGRWGALSYTGHVSGSGEKFLVEGKAQVGQTEFFGTLSGSIKVDPHAKKTRFIESTTPFSIEGPLASPSIKVKGVTARMIGEVILAPIHLLGSALLPFVHDHGKDPKNPCLIIRAVEPEG
jgi:hypothetical protein